MERLRISLTPLIVGCGIVFSTLPALGQTLNTLTQEETAAGWKLLFNGTSNAGWVKTNGAAGQFTLEENALGASGGDICTQDEYENFEFVTDYKYGAAGNSGIFIRTRKNVEPAYKSGIEISIQDNGQAGNLINTGDAAVYGIKAASVDKWTGPGIWNTQRVRVTGTRIENFHNGAKVIDLDMASAEWASLFAKSKFADGTWPIWGKDSKGLICLQDHGYKILFRNIKVLALPAGASARPRSPADGFRWEIRGNAYDRKLAVELPGIRDYDIVLLDLGGKEVRSLKGRGARNEISLRALPKGLYWLRVVTPDFTAERRIALL